MNDQHQFASQNSYEAYDETLKGILSDEFGEYSSYELEEVLVDTLENLPEEEAEELFGVLSGIAAIAAPAVKKIMTKRVGKFILKKGRNLVRRKFKFRNRNFRRRKSLFKNKAIGFLLRMVKSKNFHNLLAGKAINIATGTKIGKTKVNISLKRGGKRETAVVSFDEYMQAINYLTHVISTNQDGTESGFLLEDDLNDLDQNLSTGRMVVEALFEDELADSNEYEDDQTDEYSFLEEDLML
ncbi:MAG: hypothetical protein AAF502_23320 [Bacteroidota bacterium]